MTSPNTLTGPDGRRYAIRLDRDQIAGITSHFHWIPASRGYLRDYVSRTHPGWDSNNFATVFNAARILKQSGVGGPPHPHRWVVAVWISADLEWLVETTRQERPTYSSTNE